MPGPIVPPLLFHFFAIFIGEARRIDRRLRTGRRPAAGEEAAQRLVALRRSPEAVPAALRSMQLQRDLLDRPQRAQAGADIDVRFGAELVQHLLDTWVLSQGLDERPDREERRQIHLLRELRDPARRKARVDPGLVVVEVEVRLPDEEVRGAEAVERREPALLRLEVALELLDVPRARCNDSPAEDSDPRHDSLLTGCSANRASRKSRSTTRCE